MTLHLVPNDNVAHLGPPNEEPLAEEPLVSDPTEHCVIIAVTVRANTPQQAARAVYDAMPVITSERPITSWWHADDARWDGSDNDSAVFVTPGNQAHAADILVMHGLTGAWNIPDRDRELTFEEDQ